MVLTRKKNEEILIYDRNGEKVTLMVVDIRGDRVRLGLSAPRDCKIIRKEVDDREREEANH